MLIEVGVIHAYSGVFQERLVAICKLNLGASEFFINARGKRGAVIFARSMLTEEMARDLTVSIEEGEGTDATVIFASTVDAMLIKDVGRPRPPA